VHAPIAEEKVEVGSADPGMITRCHDPLIDSVGGLELRTAVSRPAHQLQATRARPALSYAALIRREGNAWDIPESEADLRRVVVQRQVGPVNQQVQYPVRQHGQR
jgi:hypothetical protein